MAVDSNSRFGLQHTKKRKTACKKEKKERKKRIVGKPVGDCSPIDLYNTEMIVKEDISIPHQC
jgi:hypothetical protein